MPLICFGFIKSQPKKNDNESAKLCNLVSTKRHPSEPLSLEKSNTLIRAELLVVCISFNCLVLTHWTRSSPFQWCLVFHLIFWSCLVCMAWLLCFSRVLDLEAYAVTVLHFDGSFSVLKKFSGKIDLPVFCKETVTTASNNKHWIVEIVSETTLRLEQNGEPYM